MDQYQSVDLSPFPTLLLLLLPWPSSVRTLAFPAETEPASVAVQLYSLKKQPLPPSVYGLPLVRIIILHGVALTYEVCTQKKGSVRRPQSLRWFATSHCTVTNLIVSVT